MAQRQASNLKLMGHFCRSLPVSDANEIHKLIQSIQQGNTDKALSLMKAFQASGIPLDLVVQNNTPLCAAIVAGNDQVFDALLATGLSVNPTLVLGLNIPLAEAASAGRLRMIEALLDRGADPNVPMRRPDLMDGCTALVLAIFSNQRSAVELLVNRGARLFLDSPAAYSPLDAARFCGKALATFIRKLALAHPDLRRYVSLHEAALFGLTPLLTQLLEEGADPNAYDSDGRNLLQLASSSGNLSGVEVLLKRGADPNLPDQNGHPLLVNACHDLPLTKMLLSAGANPNVKVEGVHLIEYLSRQSVSRPVLDVLLAAIPAEDRPYTATANPEVEALRKHLKQLPRLGESPKFQATVSLLEQLFNRKASAWKKRKGALAFPAVSLAKHLKAAFGEQPVEENFYKLVLQIQAEGFTLFAAQSIGEEEKVQVILIPTMDALAPALAPVLCSGTNGANKGLDTSAVAAWLADLYKGDPFVTLAAGFDFLHARFLEPASEPEAIASRMLKFCPDLASSASEDVAEIAQELRDNRHFHFWWD